MTRNQMNHPSRTRLHGELNDTRQNWAAIEDGMGYHERTFMESNSRRNADRAIDHRRKWAGRAAVVGSIVTLAAGVAVAGRAIAQNETSHQADAGNVPELLHKHAEQQAGVEQAKQHEDQ